MGNISSILGVDFSPLLDNVSLSAEHQLHSAMLSHGITPPDQIILDGKLRRFSSGTKGSGGNGDKTGWYIGFSDGIPAAKFGCWRSGVEVNFRAEIGRKLSAAEEIINSRRMSEAKAIRDYDLQKDRERASSTVIKIWTEGIHSDDNHAYLKRKGIGFNGARITGDGRLMVPLYNIDGELSSIQYIGTEGEKKYHPGGQTSSCFWYLGQNSETIYVAEGFATAATIYEETSKLTYIAYSASNIPNVVKILHEKYGPLQDICVIADNDESGIGLKYADQASAKYGCRVIMPPIKGDANDYKQSGNDLLSLLQPKLDYWLVQADDFSNQPSAISWLIKGWLQDKALIMVHGPSGGGKTFVVLDWCLNISSQNSTWFDNRIANGSVVYLAGEGHQGLRGRIAAWKQHHKVSKLDMWLSKDGCNLNTSEGYHIVLSNIRRLNIKPKVIVVDTLHRFLQGDENSAQDTKTMLDSCSALMTEFNCSVLLVHHTGVNDEAQHRARGSSAWRGALDIEISIVPAKGDGPIEIVQRKSKDAELSNTIYCQLTKVHIDNWIDEDNEQVTSAVITQSSKDSDKPKKDSILIQYMKRFNSAWIEYDMEIEDDIPNISRSAMREYLEKNELYKSSQSLKNALSPSYISGFIGMLVNSEVIKCNSINGNIVSYSVVNNEFLSQLLMQKSDKNV